MWLHLYKILIIITNGFIEIQKYRNPSTLNRNPAFYIENIRWDFDFEHSSVRYNKQRALLFRRRNIKKAGRKFSRINGAAA